MKRSIFLLAVIAMTAISAARAGERWTDGPDAILVLGQPDFDTNDPVASQSGLNDPHEAVVDPNTGKVFVVDSNHNRILRFASFSALSDGALAEAVFGQTNFTNTSRSDAQDKIYNSRGLAMEDDGTLWVADYRNHRILRFDDASEKTDGENADGVLGQTDFGEDTAGLSQSATGFVIDVAVDADGNLFSASTANSRVLMWENAKSLAAGSNATKVFGQEDFTSNEDMTDQDGMWAPVGVAVDGEGNLYVTDQGNQRVLRFDNPSAKMNGDDADAVFGQADFTSGSPGSAPNRFNYPERGAVDSEGTFWLADSANNRILGFKNAASLSNDPDPDYVIGQPDFESYDRGLNASEMDAPFGLGFDSAGRMFVADAGNNRVTVFEKSRFQPDFTIGEKPGKQKGKNKYNRSGAGQKDSIVTDGKEVKFITKIQNDGNVIDSFFLKSAKTSSKIRVKVFRVTGGRANVTGAAKRGNHLTAPIGVGGTLKYELKGKPKGKFKEKRKTHKLWIQATSIVDGEIDKVQGLVKNRP
ncbi:MAG: hypothetical protein CMO55_00990 [Verrucomicrobiales bacterium]|nr:hypothetical protein [Verrucomicrobiales bacterium]